MGDGFFSNLMEEFFGGGSSPAGVPAAGMALPGQADPYGGMAGPMIEGSLPGGFFDYTGDQAAGARGDEVQDAADLIALARQGVSSGYLRMEAKRRKFTRADWNAIFRVRSNVNQVAALAGLGPLEGGAFPNPAFVQIAAFVEQSLGGGRRRRRRGVGIPTMVKALQYASDLAAVIRRAGSGIARLSRPVESRSPGRVYRSGQFTKMVGRN